VIYRLDKVRKQFDVYQRITTAHRSVDRGRHRSGASARIPGDANCVNIILGGQDVAARRGEANAATVHSRQAKSRQPRTSRKKKEGKGRGVICGWAGGHLPSPKQDDMIRRAVSPKAKVAS